MWAGQADYTGTWRTDLDPDQWAYELCLKHQQTGEYIDGHCSVFTPASFLGLYRKLVELDLVDFRIATFHPTEINTIEFRVVLEKLPPGDAAQRRALQLASIPEPDDLVPTPAVEPAPAPGAVGADAVVMVVSTREQAWLQAKRRAAETTRHRLGQVRARLRR